MRDGRCLLLRRLLSLGVAAPVPVASFPSTGLWHSLNLTEDCEEGHKGKTNGQHSAEDTSPQTIKNGVKEEKWTGRGERQKQIWKQRQPSLFPTTDEIEQAKVKTNLDQWEYAGTCH